MLTKNQYKILFFIATLSILTLAIIPNGGGIDTGWDKANHFIAFFTLSLLLNRASSTLSKRIRNMLSLILFGLLIEVLQYFISYRSASLRDVMADGIGIMVFQVMLSLYRWIKKFK